MMPFRTADNARTASERCLFVGQKGIFCFATNTPHHPAPGQISEHTGKQHVESHQQQEDSHT